MCFDRQSGLIEFRVVVLLNPFSSNSDIRNQKKNHFFCKILRNSEHCEHYWILSTDFIEVRRGKKNNKKAQAS